MTKGLARGLFSGAGFTRKAHERRHGHSAFRRLAAYLDTAQASPRNVANLHGQAPSLPAQRGPPLMPGPPPPCPPPGGMNNQHPERLDTIAAAKATRKTCSNFITTFRNLGNRCLVHSRNRHRREYRIKPGLAVAAFTYLYLPWKPCGRSSWLRLAARLLADERFFTAFSAIVLAHPGMVVLG